MIYIPLVILAAIVGLLVRHGVRIERKLEARTAELLAETSLRKANQDAGAEKAKDTEENHLFTEMHNKIGAACSLDESLRTEVDSLTNALALAERKNREYFDLIQRVLAQRDEWTEMFYTHSIEHQRAQAKLESEIVRAREFLLHTIKIVNAYRDKHSEPHLELPFAASSDDPVGTAKAFGEKMDALKAKASPLIDGTKERDAIKEG